MNQDSTRLVRYYSILSLLTELVQRDVQQKSIYLHYLYEHCHLHTLMCFYINL